jgi:hypothetical protein
VQAPSVSSKTEPPTSMTERSNAQGVEGRALVVGWFSVEGGGSATAGDLEARDVVCHWLTRARRPYDIALGRPFSGGVDWRRVDPAEYACVIDVCGSVTPDSEVAAILARFPDARRIGVNVSVVRPLSEWNIFDELIERDSAHMARVDLAFAAETEHVPVVGVIRVGPQPEYRQGRHAVADAAIDDLLAQREVARVAIDTRLHENAGGLRTEAEVEAVVGCMDVIVTTGLHGLVLGLKHGVPVLAVDPVAGGAKVLSQATVLGWPSVLTVDALDDVRLESAWQFCRRPQARALAAECSRRAATAATAIRPALLGAVGRALSGQAARGAPS